MSLIDSAEPDLAQLGEQLAVYLPAETLAAMCRWTSNVTAAVDIDDIRMDMVDIRMDMDDIALLAR